MDLTIKSQYSVIVSWKNLSVAKEHLSNGSQRHHEMLLSIKMKELLPSQQIVWHENLDAYYPTDTLANSLVSNGCLICSGVGHHLCLPFCKSHCTPPLLFYFLIVIVAVTTW